MAKMVSGSRLSRQPRANSQAAKGNTNSAENSENTNRKLIACTLGRNLRQAQYMAQNTILTMINRSPKLKLNPNSREVLSCETMASTPMSETDTPNSCRPPSRSPNSSQLAATM